MAKRPLIIDCDTGTDDAIALVAAFYSPEVDLRALTCVSGNVDLPYTSRNTLDLVHYLGLDIPVAKGAMTPILRDLYKIRKIETHGQSGLGDVVLPTTDAPFCEKPAVEVIYEEAVRCGGELEIVAVGPLTNIAHAVMVHPDLPGLIKKLTFMGGAVEGGNTSTVAEFNIFCDPEAARIVLHSGIKDITMVGLDVTLKASLSEQDRDEIRAIGTPAGEFTAQILDFMFSRLEGGGEDALMHDALALASHIHDGIVRTEKFYVDAECEGTYTFGHTMVAQGWRWRKEPNCNVALEVDLPEFKKWLIGAIRNSAR